MAMDKTKERGHYQGAGKKHIADKMDAFAAQQADNFKKMGTQLDTRLDQAKLAIGPAEKGTF